MATDRDSDETARLLETLKAVRAAHGSDPPDVLREALRYAIRESVDDLPGEEAGLRLEGVRERLVGEAREREQRAERLEAEVHRLESEVESLHAERERLAAENHELRARPAGGTTGEPGGGHTLDTIREGLRQTALGNAAAPESLHLSASEARFFRLVQELLGFALRVEQAALDLRSGLGIVAGDTRVIRRLKKLIPDRFRACLNDEEGSVKALQESLAKNATFLYVLNEAYISSVKKGVPAMLGRMDPQPLQEKYLARFMKNYEGAWNELTTIQSDLAGLAPKDLWDMFFHKPFLEKLSEWEGGRRGGVASS